MTPLPGVEDVLGPAPTVELPGPAKFGAAGPLPSADQLLGPEPQTSLFDRLSTAAGKAWKWSQANVPFAGHGASLSIMRAFGHGAEAGFGEEPLGLTPQATDELKRLGIFNDYASGQSSLVREFNETMLRPAAIVGDLLLRRLPATVYGGVRGVAESPEAPEPARLVAGAATAAMEAFPAGHMTGLPVPPIVGEAHDLGIIGPEENAAAVEALRPTGAPSATERVMPAPAAPEEPPAAAPAPDIHAVARQIAPDTFTEYDALAARKATLRDWISELGDARAALPRATELQGAIDDILGKAGGIEERLTKRQAQRLAAARDELSGLLSTDTPDMAAVRRSLMETDYRMRDLAPQVSAAYRDAQAQMPPAEEAPIAPIAEAPAMQGPSSAAPEPSPPEGGAPAAPAALAEGSIAADVERQLTAAGRPAEEANAASQIVAAYYETRAGRLRGATPEELYAQDGLQVRSAEAGGRGGMAAGKAAIRNGRMVITLFRRADASTFLHETGHQWLEQLTQDALDPRATESLKTDAAAVRQWLGNDGGQISRAQHERFARGFEQYMMEGRAPSRGLARVFGQFRNWLLGVYGTAKRWGSPINEDIRRVFDRLLSAEPQPVIAGEEPLRRSLGETHERVSEDTAPENAALVADTLRAERDAASAAAGMEEFDAERRASRAAAPPRGNERGGAVSNGGGTARQLEPATTGIGPQPGALGAGRGEVAGERARMAGGEPAEPAGPDERYPDAGEPALVDKAGNIRLDLLGTPEAVNAAIRQAAEENNEFLTERRGALSDAEVSNLADALGMTAAKLNRRAIGQAFNAEQITAARRLLVESANKVREAIGKAATSGSPADLMDYLRAKDRHRMIQAQVAGVTAEAGRALRAFARAPLPDQQAEEFIEAATGRTLYQLRREVNLGQQLRTPGEISKFVHDSEKTGLFDWLQSFFINALISGPATHGTYTIANELLDLWHATAETAAGATVGKARQLFGIGDPADRMRFGEIGAGLWGWTEGNKNGWRAAWAAIKANRTLPMPGEETAAQTAFRQRVIPGKTGAVIEVPGRLINGLHTLSRTVANTRSLAQQAYRLASEEGLSGNAFKARVAELTTDPTKEMMTRAIDEANRGAMMQRAPYGSLRHHLRAIVDVGIKFPDLGPLPLGTLRPFRFVDPFVNITSNIIDNTLVERTPLGILSTHVRDDLLGRNGGAAQDLAAGKMIAGSSLMLLGGTLAASGLLTGSPPPDPKEAAIKYATGWMPYSVRVGDYYYQIHRLGPLGLALGIAADLHDVAAEAEKGEFSLAASAAVHAVARNIIDESFFKGPSDLMNAIDGRDGGYWARSFVSSFLPFSVGLGQTARVVDPYMRQTRTILDAIRAKIPYVSEGLPARYDVWGRPIPNRPALIPELTEIYTSRLENDPVDRAFLDLGYYPAPPLRRIAGVELTPQQYADYARIGGRFARMRVDAIVGLPGFAELPPGTRHEMLRNAISAARKTARDLVMMRSVGSEHDILAQAVAARRAALRPPEK